MIIAATSVFGAVAGALFGATGTVLARGAIVHFCSDEQDDETDPYICPETIRYTMLCTAAGMSGVFGLAALVGGYFGDKAGMEIGARVNALRKHLTSLHL